MFGLGKNDNESRGNIAEKIAGESKELYRSGGMNCAEAVLAAVVRNFIPGTSENMIHLAAGFGSGSGAGCVCGAIVGGTMALGLICGEDRNRAKRLTRELQRWFREAYGATCCKVILQTHKKICHELTGRVAGKVAEMLETKGGSDID